MPIASRGWIVSFAVVISTSKISWAVRIVITITTSYIAGAGTSTATPVYIWHAITLSGCRSWSWRGTKAAIGNQSPVTSGRRKISCTVVCSAFQISSTVWIRVTVASPKIAWLLACTASPIRVWHTVAYSGSLGRGLSWVICWNGWEMYIKEFSRGSYNDFTIAKRNKCMILLTTSQTEGAISSHHSSVPSCKIFSAASCKFVNPGSWAVVHQTIDSCTCISIAVVFDVTGTAAPKVMIHS